MAEWERRLAERLPARFGLVALRVTLGVAGYYALVSGMHGCGERLHHLSVIGLSGVELCRVPRLVFSLLQVLFALAAVLWAVQKAVPYSAWAATGLFLLVESIRQETSYYSDHQPYTVTMVMVLLCAWYQMERRGIRAAAAEGRLAEAPVLPRWVPVLAIFYLGLTYTLSGIDKLTHSGPAWADGTALRLWLVHSGAAETALGGWIAASPRVALALQTTTLLVETLAILATRTRITSIALGVILIGMHAATTPLFGVYFFGNIVLCAVFLVWYPSRIGLS